MSKHLTAEDLEMVDDVYGAIMTDAPTGHRLIIWSLAAMVLCFIIWSYFSELDQVTTGMGKVIPSSQLQVIQSLDGGILQEIYVQEGVIVTKGQPLARIDDTRFRSDFGQQEQEVFGLHETPKVLNNTLALQVHLLTPAMTPMQITYDLKSFWENSYDEVRKELFSKYKKHYWPKNPLEAIATRKTKKFM